MRDFKDVVLIIPIVIVSNNNTDNRQHSSSDIPSVILTTRMTKMITITMTAMTLLMKGNDAIKILPMSIVMITDTVTISITEKT